MKKLVIAAAVMALTLVSQSYAREGFYLGLQIPYNTIGGDFDNVKMPEVDAGSGFGFIAGYGFSPAFSLELDWAGSGHSSAGANIGFGEFSLNGKYAFQTDSQTQPFLLAGLGAYTLGDSSLTFGGSGYNLGVGLDYYSSSKVSLGIALIQKFITYDEILESDVPLTMNQNLNGDTTSIRFDATYHF